MSAGSSDEGFEKNKEQPAPLREGEGHTLCWLLRELFLPDRSVGVKGLGEGGSMVCVAGEMGRKHHKRPA